MIQYFDPNVNSIEVNFLCPIDHSNVSKEIFDLPIPDYLAGVESEISAETEVRIECSQHHYYILVICVNLNEAHAELKDESANSIDFELIEHYNEGQIAEIVEQEEEKNTRLTPSWRDLDGYNLLQVVGSKKGFPIWLMRRLTNFLYQKGVVSHPQFEHNHPKYVFKKDFEHYMFNEGQQSLSRYPLDASVVRLCQNMTSDIPSNLAFKNFEIKNYKNHNNLEIRDCRTLNLFVGANNAGKSNVLEALSLYCSNFSMDRIMSILNERKEKILLFDSNHNSYSPQELLDIIYPLVPSRTADFFRKTQNNSIVLGCKNVYLQFALVYVYYDKNSSSYEAKISRISPYNVLSDRQMVFSRELMLMVRQVRSNDTDVHSIQAVPENKISLYRLKPNGFEPLSPENLGRPKNFQYINCKRLVTGNIEKLWSIFAMTNEADVVMSALKIIDNRVTDFEFLRVNENHYAPFVKLNSGMKIPLSAMGDGITHILTIISAIMGCKDGVLLLDEAESGLHYYSQKSMWKLITALAKRYNVQVFASTHSNDCIAAFVNTNDDSSAAVYRIEVQENSTDCIRYKSIEKVKTALKNNIEIR